MMNERIEILSFERWSLFEDGDSYLLVGPEAFSWSELVGLAAEILLIKEGEDNAPFRKAREALLPADLADPRTWLAPSGRVLKNRQLEIIERKEHAASERGVLPPEARLYSEKSVESGILEVGKGTFQLCDETGAATNRFSAGRLSLTALFIVSDERTREYENQYSWVVAEHLPSANPQIDRIQREGRNLLRKHIEHIHAI